MNLKAVLLLFIGILSISIGYTKEILVSKADFEISKKMLESNDIYYSYSEYTKGRFSKLGLSDFDVEGLSEDSNSRIFFARSAFSIDKKIEELDTSIFKNTNLIKDIMGASSLKEQSTEKSVWNSVIPIYIYDVESKLEVKQLSYSQLENDIFEEYFHASDRITTDLPKSDYQVHIRLTEFNMGFDRLVVVCNFIPMKTKTAVVCHVIAKANNSWWKNRNIFGIASKRMKKIISRVLINTKAHLK